MADGAAVVVLVQSVAVRDGCISLLSCVHQLSSHGVPAVSAADPVGLRAKFLGINLGINLPVRFELDEPGIVDVVPHGITKSAPALP